MINRWIEFATELIPYIVMAMFGGIANLIISKKKEDIYSLGFIIGEIFLAMFCGMLIYLLLTDMKVNGTYIALACSIAGTIPRRVLTLLQSRFSAKIESSNN